jgi:hypothetical protein
MTWVVVKIMIRKNQALICIKVAEIQESVWMMTMMMIISLRHNKLDLILLVKKIKMSLIQPMVEGKIQLEQQ